MRHFSRQELSMTKKKLMNRGMGEFEAEKQVAGMIKCVQDNNIAEENRRKDHEKQYEKQRFREEWNTLTKRK